MHITNKLSLASTKTPWSGGYLKHATCASLLLFSALGYTAVPHDLTELSLEELMEVEIFSVAKKAQRLSEAAAAISVITQEDIRRSGVSSVPELLRMVPGIQVAQISANEWAISARGFNNRFSNKLLVLIDGRTVYTPLFSGVYWNMQDVVLEDIETIEVVRGPGGTLWGANAVNGVINIRTKHARDSQGSLVAVTAGNQEHGGVLRHGGQLGEKADYRIYAKGFRRDDFVDALDDPSHDKWDKLQGGFRVDWARSSQDSLTVQGDYYDGEADQSVGVTSLTPPSSAFVNDTMETEGGNLLLRWQRKLSKGSEWFLQAYYDYAERKEISLDQRINTFDLDFQHRLPLGGRQEITWGAGYRHVDDDLKGSFTVSFGDIERRTDVFSFFAQDEIKLRDGLRLTVGSKFEHNDYTGFEYQPSVRVLWQMQDNHSLWAAVSRAVRTPSRSDSDIRINVAAIPGAPPTLISILGSEDLDSEELLSFELGYRGQVRPDLSLDITAFYNFYDNLASSEPGVAFEAAPAPPHLLLSRTFDNLIEAESYGLELSAKWQVTRKWRLHAAYSWLEIDARADASSGDTIVPPRLEGSDPEHQVQLQSYLGLPHDLELDTALYYIDSLSDKDISSYSRLDVRLGWRPNKALELSLGLQNLLDDRHPEFVVNDIVASEVPRSILGKLVWRL